jgi:hypothetical protein
MKDVRDGTGRRDLLGPLISYTSKCHSQKIFWYDLHIGIGRTILSNSEGNLGVCMR